MSSEQNARNERGSDPASEGSGVIPPDVVPDDNSDSGTETFVPADHAVDQNIDEDEEDEQVEPESNADLLTDREPDTLVPKEDEDDDDYVEESDADHYDANAIVLPFDVSSEGSAEDDADEEVFQAGQIHSAIRQ